VLLACRACGARHALDPAARALLSEDRGAVLRCPECGRLTARVVPGALRATPAPRAAAVVPPSSRPVPPVADLGDAAGMEGDEAWGGREILLRRAGRVIPFAGLDPLRRLAVQGRILAGDVLSRDGVCWEPVERVPELAPFLAVSRSLAELADAGRGSVLVDASAAEDGWSDAADAITESVPRPGAATP